MSRALFWQWQHSWIAFWQTLSFYYLILTNKTNALWEIVGYPKDQRFVLNRFIYTFEMLDDHGGYYVKQNEQGGNEDND